MLKGFKAITPECMRRDTYRECLRRFLEEKEFTDVCFIVHGVKLHAHRIILIARSPYFASMFETKWRGKSTIRLSHPLVKPLAFKAILQYLYTGRLYVDVSGVEDCIILARQCKLTKLREILRERLNFIDTFENSKKVSQPIKVVSVEPDAYSKDLNEAFGSLVELVIPHPYRNQQLLNGSFENIVTEETEALLPFMNWSYADDEIFPEDRPPYADICFVVEEARFYCHKVFICGRSDYFKALLIDHFSEAVLPDTVQHSPTEDSVPEVTLHDVSAEDFSAIVAYIYQDMTQVKVENLFSVLCAADLYLLNGLKRLCANQIKDHLDVDNIIPILRTARLFSLEGLESNCVMFLAKYLEKFIEDTEFHKLIVEDAATIENREEKDSIPIVDEIRFHLMNNVLPVTNFPESNVYDSDIKLALLDELLKTLDLEC